MYSLYRLASTLLLPILPFLLRNRIKRCKEDEIRYTEKLATITRVRPVGNLLWVHAASVGEAQSALILIKCCLEKYRNLNILVTTGTVTSATLMEKQLPKGAFHQYMPLDHPRYVKKFLTYWRPDIIFWMESELWPNMLHDIKRRGIPAYLINARMSKKSFMSWKKFRVLVHSMLSTFDTIFCQTEHDAQLFRSLGAPQTIVFGNLKYSANKLEYNQDDKESLLAAISNRPIWLYASTHDPEEEIACKVHNELKKDFPDLLTIIVPRHPERRNDIRDKCLYYNQKIILRGQNQNLPDSETEIYIADTLGELGLFYSITDITCIGRTFSNDGGGGHNPIEPAQLDCAIIYGPNVQNLQEIFDELKEHNAALLCRTTKELQQKIHLLLKNSDEKDILIKNAKTFSLEKTGVSEKIIDNISPTLDKIFL